MVPCIAAIHEHNEAAVSQEDGMTTVLALATVDDEETSLTLGIPTAMTDDELAGVVIQAFAKIRDYIPYIVELKSRFDAAERNSENRLRTPIRGCYSWKEFCTSILNRTPRNIWDACRDKKEKQEARQLTDADVTVYEQEHPEIRKVTSNFLLQMTAADTIGALVGMGTPPPIAEAIVRIVVAENIETQQPSKSSELKSALDQQIAKARELTSLFTDAEVSRSETENLFHLTLRNLTEEEVRQIGGGVAK